jgi:hypothetical protein
MNNWQEIKVEKTVGYGMGGHVYYRIGEEFDYGYDILHIPTGLIAKKHRWSRTDKEGNITFNWDKNSRKPIYVNVKECRIRHDDERYKKLQQWINLKIGDFVRISSPRGKKQPWRKILRIDKYSIYGQIARGPSDKELVLASAKNAIWSIVEKA